MKKPFLALAAIGVLALSSPVLANDNEEGECGISKSVVAKIQAQLATVVTMDNGGLFTPNRMWSAVVDRKGVLCSVISTGDAWPGSRAIAIAKASTANDFSNSALALSTANVFSPTQPGGSLYGLNNSNPFNPEFLPQGQGLGQVPGGIITFGGGVALYSGNTVIGGLGVSGDTSCADHVIAFRMRRLAGFGTVPKGVASVPPNSDNIIYDITPNPDGGTGISAGGFGHPHCSSGDIDPSKI
jgi:uncharacterized protein GlcG (DUF336 family)